MLLEKNLNKVNEDTHTQFQKMNIIVEYLLLGNELKFDNYRWKMDGDLNPYIACEAEQNGVNVGTTPLFQNNGFWEMLKEMAKDIDKETFDEIRFTVAATKVLRKTNKKR